MGLGLANQLAFFLPDLAQSTCTMRKLLKKDVEFLWLPEHEEEFQKAKQLLTSDLLVKHFDPSLPTEVLTDASRLFGLGYCLVQHGPDQKLHLIACGSKSLTDAQTRYATIELECLGVQWAISKCEFWLRGMTKFTVVTDHRPLLGVFSKHLHEVENPRLQRLRTKLMGYNFNVVWQPGKEHVIADVLSRAPVWPASEDEDEEVVHACVVQEKVLDTQLQIFYKAAAHDEEYTKLVDAIRGGHDPHELPVEHPARLYKHVWDQLSLHVNDSSYLVLFQGTKIVVPATARPEVLKILHIPHQGLVKTKQQARRYYYWPGMTSAVTNLVEGCYTCRKYLSSQASEPFLEAEEPTGPMVHVGSDLFSAAGKDYLILVDRFSGYFFVQEIKNQSTSTVVKHLKKWFLEYGWPTSIRTDGGPCFRSDFKLFCQEHQILHELASAYNPQSNGLAEAAVKNAKKLLLKCKDEGEDYQTALSEFRLTPRADGFSPAELFFGRRPRGALPVFPHEEQGKVDVQKGATRHQTLQDVVASRGGCPLSRLSVGTRVLIQHPITKLWSQEGKVSEIREGGRSYIVEVDGKSFIRNRRFLRPCINEQYCEKLEKTDTEKTVEPRRSSRVALMQKKRVQFCN